MASSKIIPWFVLACAAILPIVIAAKSPYVQGREFVYLAGSMGGIIALSLLLLQPILAGHYLPTLPIARARRWHRGIGILLVFTIMVHIVGLYIASPMDMTDALLLKAPTSFSVYGVIGLWSLVATVIMVAFRSQWRWSHRAWKVLHNLLALAVVIASVTHALMIDGLMGQFSKLALCVCVVLTIVATTVHLRIIKTRQR